MLEGHVHSTSAYIDSSSLSISNRHRSVWIWLSSHVDEALFTHTHTHLHRYVSGVDVRALCAIITMATCRNNHRRRHTHLSPQSARSWLTEIHSSDLVLSICLCFSSIFIIPPPQTFQNIFHFSFLTDKHRLRYLLVRINQSRSSQMFCFPFFLQTISS